VKRSQVTTALPKESQMHKRRGMFALLAAVVMASVCTAADWPQFRGPHRDGKSTETGLLRKWPEGGPKLFWSVEGLGAEYSSAAIAEALVYTTGKHGADGYIFCFDLNGKPQWKVAYGPEWAKSYPATRTTPTVNDGRLYVFSGLGAVYCLDAKTGVDGYIYGANFQSMMRGNWASLDWNTGKVMYDSTWQGSKGSTIYADGMLYCYAENTGDVGLAKATPDGFNVVSSFKITAGKSKHWAHPSISYGRLYIRHGDVMMVYCLSAKDQIGCSQIPYAFKLQGQYNATT